jgi:hypothetical protein
MLFCRRICTVPWTVPEIESGRCNVLRLPNAVLLLNQESNIDLTSKVSVGPETEQPETLPQLSVTGDDVLNVKLNWEISRVVEYKLIDTANPF